MKIGAEEFCDEVNVLKGRNENVAQTDDLLFVRPFLRPAHLYTDIFMSKMFEKLQFTVSSLGEDRRAKGLHNLLDRHGLVCELVLRRANEAKGAHADWLQISVPACYLERRAKNLSAHEFSHGES